MVGRGIIPLTLESPIECVKVKSILNKHGKRGNWLLRILALFLAFFFFSGIAFSLSAEWKTSLERLKKFGLTPSDYAIVIDISEQKLYLLKGFKIVRIYPVSTSRYGVGGEEGSFKTPLGMHRVFEKIGYGALLGTIFERRKNTGKIARIYTDNTDLPEDIITTRIIRLEGSEEGVNKGKGVDSLRRFIYIHGTPEEGLIGKPASRGCIRMKNRDIIELFDLIDVGTLVEIRQ